MSKSNPIVALGVALAVAAAPEALAQGSAADFFNSQIRNSAVGTGYTVGNVVANNFARTQGPGVRNFQGGGTSISSGFGATPLRSSIPTFGGAPSARGRKPFSSLNRTPTVSPYLNLFNTGIGGTSSVDNYNVLVRPQLEQQRTNRQLQMQTQRLNQRVQSISAQPAFQARGSERMMATGHSTTFGYYSHFYPAKNRRR